MNNLPLVIPSDSHALAQGTHLFTTRGCADCHGVDGTDHDWGGHHFVIGNAVRGQSLYGSMPSLRAQGNPDDTGHGQLIPTTAVDRYTATLAERSGR